MTNLRANPLHNAKRTKPLSGEVRIPRSFGIELALNEQLRQFALDQHYNLSDCVNIAIREFLKNRGQ